MQEEPPRTRAFVLAALAWSVGLFGLLRSGWVQERLVLPFTRLQKQAADHYAGGTAVPVAVTLDCSGTDVLALCLAAVLACPVPWRARLGGGAGGIALVLVLNIVRIATLGRAAASPALFRTLHVHVWPAILVLATAAYVFAWMRWALATTARGHAGASAPGDAVSALMRRFVPWAALLLVAFALCTPWTMSSGTLVEAGAWVARCAAFLLTAAGITATATGNVLATSRGAFMVTPECVGTALIPLYVAGALAVRLSWPRRVLALAAGPPLFAALAVARVLVLALPPALVSSPLFLVHGFHQIVLAVVGVVLLALWREPPAPGRWKRSALRAGAAVGAAALLAAVAGPALTGLARGAARAVSLAAPHTLIELAAPGDVQGTLALLPVYQAGLLLALGVTAFPGWRRFAFACGLLLVSQVVLLAVLGELAAHAGLAAHALVLRAWAVAVPVAIALALLRPLAPAPAELVLRPAACGPL
jgi:exosortase/archaeosortase family protein